MPRIKEIAEKHSLKIITDSCQAHGSCKGDDLGDAGAFSFYPGKNLGALGDGGCLCTNDEELAEYARTFCNYGASRKYQHDIIGINSRLDAIQAAMLTEKLKQLDRQNAIRQDIASLYLNKINNAFVTKPYTQDPTTISNWHIYPILCDNRLELQLHLADKGIETLIHYPTPPHKQLAYKSLNNLSLPNTERICKQELSLPLNPTLTLEQQEYIIGAINKFKIQL